MSKNTNLVPIQYMVPKGERVKTRALAKKRGHRSIRDYLRSLVAADAASAK